MARWDEILSLPVQNPPSLEFSATELVWSKIEGWRDNMDRLALIPFARVDDFVKGESANKDCPTRFHVEARRRRPPEASYKQKVDGILEYILYWCSFGPDDHRKGGVVRPSRSTYIPKKKKTAGRPNTKRGCTCHFIVKRLIAEPSVALIIYNQDKHVDKKGLPCHGPQDKKAEGTRAMFAPYISEDLRLRVLSLLYVGVSVETIMQRHNELVQKQGGPCNRDDLLTHRYVRRQERNIRRSTYELDVDEAVSISMWVESHQSHVFFYEDFSDSDPFTLGIQTEWQLQQMIKFGNCSLLASDSRFGTSKLKYPVHSLVVFNSNNKAIPVAWIITPRFANADPHKWMRALYNRVRAKDPMWKLAGFIVDEPLMDIIAIRDVFQCSVLLSLWRVRHAWHKNVVKKCAGIEMRVQVAKKLGELVDVISRGHGSTDLFEAFMVDFVDSSDFTEYFKAVWYPRIGTWTSTLRALPSASQESSAAMEFYHNQLKVRLMNEKDPEVYQRANWLVDKLGTKVHSYFWLDEYTERDYYARYWKDEWISGLTAWGKALKIPEADVSLENECAKVMDQIDRDRIHVIRNPGSQFAICDCPWAEMGNLCEHALKATRLYRDKGYAKPSVSLSQYKQALIDMLCCPPRDSLVRDYAVTLAVTVQKHLQSLRGLDSYQMTMDSARRETLELPGRVPDSSDQNKHTNAECKCIDGYVPSHELHSLEPQNAMTDLLNQDNQLRDESRCMDGNVPSCGRDTVMPQNAASDLSDQDKELVTEGQGLDEVIPFQGSDTLESQTDVAGLVHRDQGLKDESMDENVPPHKRDSLEHETAMEDSVNQVNQLLGKTRNMNIDVLVPCSKEKDSAGGDEAPDVVSYDVDENNKGGSSHMDVDAISASVCGSPPASCPAEEAVHHAASDLSDQDKELVAEGQDLDEVIPFQGSDTLEPRTDVECSIHRDEELKDENVDENVPPRNRDSLGHETGMEDSLNQDNHLLDKTRCMNSDASVPCCREKDSAAGDEAPNVVSRDADENNKGGISRMDVGAVSACVHGSSPASCPADKAAPHGTSLNEEKDQPAEHDDLTGEAEPAREAESANCIDYEGEASVTTHVEDAPASTDKEAVLLSMAVASRMPRTETTSTRENGLMEPESKKRKTDHGSIDTV